VVTRWRPLTRTSAGTQANHGVGARQRTPTDTVPRLAAGGQKGFELEAGLQCVVGGEVADLDAHFARQAAGLQIEKRPISACTGAGPDRRRPRRRSPHTGLRRSGRKGGGRAGHECRRVGAEGWGGKQCAIRPYRHPRQGSEQGAGGQLPIRPAIVAAPAAASRPAGAGAAASRQLGRELPPVRPIAGIGGTYHRWHGSCNGWPAGRLRRIDGGAETNRG
jgi:hypothetical protein